MTVTGRRTEPAAGLSESFYLMFVVFLTVECLSPCKAPSGFRLRGYRGRDQAVALSEYHKSRYAGLGRVRFLGQLHIPSVYYGNIQLVTRQRAATLAKG